MAGLVPLLSEPQNPHQRRRPLVRVVHIENPSDFYVQLYRPKPYNEFYNIGRYCGNLINNKELKTGNKVLLETSDGWRRNIVTGLDNSHVHLRDLDFGISRNVKKTVHLYAVNKEDCVIEPQAIHCKLYWAIPIATNGWTESNTDAMKYFLKNYNYVAEMELFECQNDMYEVDLWNGPVDPISRRLIYANEAMFRN